VSDENRSANASAEWRLCRNFLAASDALAGTRHLLNVHFVVPDLIDRMHLQLLHELQDERESADYAATYPNDGGRFEVHRARATAALAAVHALLVRAGVPADPAE
jgi:hypothetical protein